MINNTKYKLDLSDKIPSSYSIVVENVPSQWSVQAFDNELKQHYPSIVRVVRLFISGGRPFSNVHDDNTAFDVQPYLPPTRILQYYNCQVYDDHIAAHCPNKDNPVRFRRAQHHSYKPNGNNVIKCAHHQGDHMTGNPSCPVNSEKRQEKKSTIENIT
ncbi:unnamed protein product [Rotaria sordida]|uniref:Uncharacterized protein n=1 Tax=Rotaria sordida TaxID=392033 RepID=A0A820A9K9_9BILA|nr:unnamed protein product [Rotaria sordida]